MTDAFLERCAFTILTELGELAGSPREVWEQASIEDRKRLMGLVISKIVATPVDPPVPFGQRRVRLNHDIDIHWRVGVAATEQIAVAATQAPLEPPPREISKSRAVRFRRQEVKALQGQDPLPQRPSPVGKNWAEYQRECLAAR